MGTANAAEAASRRRFAHAVRWCKRHLPDEHSHLAASSYLTLAMHGGQPTPEQVYERLKAQGRDYATMKAKGWVT